MFDPYDAEAGPAAPMPDSPEAAPGGASGLPPDDGWIETVPARRPPRSRSELLAHMPRRRRVPIGALLALVAVLAAGAWAVGQFGAKAHRRSVTDEVQPAVAPTIGVAPSEPAVEMPPRAIEHPDPQAMPAEAGRPSRWTTSVSAAEAEARRTGKPVLIDFNAAWCPPCRAMRAELFDDPTLGEIVSRLVVPVSIVDRSREDGSNSAEVEGLMQGYSIDAFPTLVIYRPGGGRTLRTSGFGSAEQTLDWIRNAANATR